MLLLFSLFFNSANLTTAGMVINGTEISVVNINKSITSVNLIITGDGNVAEFTDGEGESMDKTKNICLVYKANGGGADSGQSPGFRKKCE